MTTTLTFQYEQISTSAHTIEDAYDVALTHTDKVGFGGSDDGVQLTLQLSGKWTWTNTFSVEKSASVTNTAILAAGGPHCGYKGAATQIAVYYDKVYNTYAFREQPGDPALQGNAAIASAPKVAAHISTSGADIVDAIAVPINAVEVWLVDANGQEKRTFSNANGDWTFLGPLAFPVTVTANGNTQIYRQTSSGAGFETQTVQRDKFIRK